MTKGFLGYLIYPYRKEFSRSNEDVPADIDFNMITSLFVFVGKIINDTYEHDDIAWNHPQCLNEFNFTQIEPNDVLKFLSSLLSHSNIDSYYVQLHLSSAHLT